MPGVFTEAHLNTTRMVMDARFTDIYLSQLMLLPEIDLAASQVNEKYELTTRHHNFSASSHNLEFRRIELDLPFSLNSDPWLM